MNRRTSSRIVLGVFLCLIALSAVSPVAEARTQKQLAQKTELRPVGWKAGDVVWFAPGDYWVDDFDGGVQSGTLGETKVLKVWNTTDTVNFGPGFIRFEQAGGVKEGILAADTALRVVNTASSKKQTLTFKGGTAVEFGYDGGVMHGTLANATTLELFGPDAPDIKPSGDSKDYPAGTEVDFSGGGRLMRALAPRTAPANSGIDGVYACTGVLTCTDRDESISIAFKLVASGGAFAGGGDGKRYSLQMKGDFDSKTGVITSGFVTGWVDLATVGVDEPTVPVLRWTVRGIINGTIQPAASGKLRVTTFESPPRPNAGGPFTLTGPWTGTRTGPVPTTAPAEEQLFTNGNGGGVFNKPTKPTVFTVKKSCTITYVLTYHWNDGKGTSEPGQISLKHEDGTVYGPWQAVGTPGQGGVRNANWECRPNVAVKEGTYTVIDSDPATWAQNGGSGGQGMSIVRRKSD